MKRSDRKVILLIAFLVPWIARLPCHAQPPVPKAVPPAQPAPSAPGKPGVNSPTPRPVEVEKLPPASQPMLSGQVNLKPPPLEAADLPLPINLAAALKLADARPLIIAAAQASAWVAEAQLQRAKLLWVPTLDLAAIYVRHDGFGPDLNRGANNFFDAATQNTIPLTFSAQKLPINQNLNWFYGGGGLNVQVALTDAIFTPLAARQDLNSRRWDIQTAKNDALLMTADAYFNVHRYRGTYAGAIDVVDRGHKLVDRITQLSKDLVPRVEVDRAKRALADFQQQAASARENWRVASADLTQVLRLDPRAVVVPLEHDHLQITLIDPAQPLDGLMPIAMNNRPEVAAQQALIQASLVRVRREKLRPFLPTVLITGFQNPGAMTMQFMAYGEGSAGKMNLWSFRNEFSPQLVWQLEGFGFGNLARVKEQRGDQSEAIVQLYRIQDAVVAEVTQAQANLQSAAVRVLEADRSLRQALITYEGNYEGLRQTRRFENLLVQVYRPQEAVQALHRLRIAYDEYFGTVADYNRAQFRLFHALGYPAQDVSNLQPPGEAAPVDTERPSYMPPVGEGPPPSTR